MLNDFYEWLDWGITKGWVADVACAIHGGLPLELEEDVQFPEGEDPCVHVIRVSGGILDTRS